MRSGTPQHPFGHGAALDEQERARLGAIAQAHADDLGPRLRWPGPRPDLRRADPGQRRVLRRTGWPAWLALLLGVALMTVGVRQDQGWPLLVGTVLALTFNLWLALPRLAALPAATRDRYRDLWAGRS